MFLGVAQLGSALEWGSRGRGFKSLHPDHLMKVINPCKYSICKGFNYVYLTSYIMKSNSKVRQNHVFYTVHYYQITITLLTLFLYINRIKLTQMLSVTNKLLTDAFYNLLIASAHFAFSISDSNCSKEDSPPESKSIIAFAAGW